MTSNPISQKNSAIEAPMLQPPDKPTCPPNKKLPDEPTRKNIFINAWYSTLAITIVIMPLVCSIITLGLYFLLPNPSKWQSILFGLGITIAFWLLLATFWSIVWSILAISNKNSGESHIVLQLRCRLERIKVHLIHAPACIPHQEAKVYVQNGLDLLERTSTGPICVYNNNHLGACRAIHRAEEDLFLFDPLDATNVRALHDRLRMEESHIDSQKQLLQLLEKSMEIFNLKEHSYFDGNHPWSDISNRLANIEAKLEQPSGKTDQQHKGYSKPNKEENTEQQIARNMFHEVRRAYNDFRDNRLESIIHLRDQLVRGLVSAEVITYSLLIFIILTLSGMTGKELKADQSLLIAGATFYIVGSMAGLFGRFFFESDLSSLSQDYGLSLVRLIATPVFSGLAGIGGVFITRVVTELSQQGIANMSIIFHLDAFNLFTAAVFGLTPNLVMQSLKRAADSMKLDEKKIIPEQPRAGGGQI